LWLAFWWLGLVGFGFPWLGAQIGRFSISRVDRKVPPTTGLPTRLAATKIYIYKKNGKKKTENNTEAPQTLDEAI